MQRDKYLNCNSDFQKDTNQKCITEGSGTQQITLSVFRHLKHILSEGTSAF